MAKTLLRLLNSLTDLLVMLALLLAGAYSVYGLWDNRQVYAAAENVQAEMLALKPEAEAADGDSFARLRDINPDVCAWLTLEHTGIDAPILQGEDNLRYLNTDVYGGFSLAGSVFLDSRSDRGFADAFSLLYGHHMDKGKMFGDLDLYGDAAFFAHNSSGMLILPDRRYRLEVFACLLVPASESVIFDPPQTDIPALLDFAADRSALLRSETVEELRASAAPQVLGLSTCSPAFTDARTVVLARMEPCLPEN